MVKRWIESILQNVVATVLIALVPGAGIAYLARIGSQWTTPLLLGGLAAALSSLTAFLLRRQIGLPIKRETVSIENVEDLTRVWLNNFRVGIKNDPLPEASFRFLVTMDGGMQLIIGRPRNEFSDYLIVRHDIAPTPDEQDVIA